MSQDPVYLCPTLMPPSENSIAVNNNIKNAGPSGRSPAEIVGSNPTGGMDICLL
jgi:hypothetical protein